MTEQQPYNHQETSTPEMEQAEITIGLIQLEHMLTGGDRAFLYNQYSVSKTQEGGIQIDKLDPELVNLAIAVRRFTISPALQEFHQSQAQILQSARQGLPSITPQGN